MTDEDGAQRAHITKNRRAAAIFSSKRRQAHKTENRNAVFIKSAGSARAFDTKAKHGKNQNLCGASAQQPFQAQPDKGVPRLERALPVSNEEVSPEYRLLRVCFRDCLPLS